MHLELHLAGQAQPFEHDVWLVRTEDRVEVEVDGQTYEATVRRRDDGRLEVALDGQRHTVEVQADGRARIDGASLGFLIAHFDPRGAPGEHDTLVQGEGVVHPPMPGKVVSLDVSEGDAVEQGDRLAVLEAMKMQSSIEAPRSGTVLAVHVEAGQAVDARDILFEIGDAS